MQISISEQHPLYLLPPVSVFYLALKKKYPNIFNSTCHQEPMSFKNQAKIHYYIMFLKPVFFTYICKCFLMGNRDLNFFRGIAVLWNSKEPWSCRYRNLNTFPITYHMHKVHISCSIPKFQWPHLSKVVHIYLNKLFLCITSKTLLKWLIYNLVNKKFSTWLESSNNIFHLFILFNLYGIISK